MHINYHISDISSLFATTNCKIFIFYILKDLIIYSLHLSVYNYKIISKKYIENYKENSKHIEV